MPNFTTRDTFIVPSFDLDVKEKEKMDKFLLLLDKSGIANLFPDDSYLNYGGRPLYSYYDMFATIIYGFAFNSCTLRDLEESCKYDLRYFYLMQQKRPTHTRFGEFINKIILPNRQEIFNLITSQIIIECD